MCTHGNLTRPTLDNLSLSSPSCLCWYAVGGLPADLLAEATVQVGSVVPSFHSAETNGDPQLSNIVRVAHVHAASFKKEVHISEPSTY